MKTIASIIAIFTLMLATTLLADEKKHEDQKGHAEHVNHMLKGYIKVSKALSADDLTTAKKEATGIVELDKKGSLAKSALAISASKDIKTAREHFLHLSMAAIKLAEEQKGYVVMVCPMVKGGEWLQTDEKVQNPYMGKKMLSCGAPKKQK